MQRDTSIAVRFKVDDDDTEHLCNYDNAEAALADLGMKAVFEQGLVVTCTIERQGKRLAGLPFMTWERFEAVLSGLISSTQGSVSL